MPSTPDISRTIRSAAALLAVAIPASLLVLGAQPVAANAVPAPWDKLVHAVVFAVFACALGLASGRRSARALLLVATGAALVGALDEAHQIWLPGREPGWDDFAADVVGSAVGASALALRHRLAAFRRPGVAA